MLCVLVAIAALLPEHGVARTLTSAAQSGDVAAIRQLVREYPSDRLDLNHAMVVSAAHNRVECMMYLEGVGATDLNEALLQAALRDRTQAIRWLISPIRLKPADNLQLAALVAAGANSVMAEWTLVCELRRREFPQNS